MNTAKNPYSLEQVYLLEQIEREIQKEREIIKKLTLLTRSLSLRAQLLQKFDFKISLKHGTASAENSRR